MINNNSCTEYGRISRKENNSCTEYGRIPRYAFPSRSWPYHSVPDGQRGIDSSSFTLPQHSDFEIALTFPDKDSFSLIHVRKKKDQQNKNLSAG
ncbi:hypothetical protein F2Q69_00026738 [Brassica cretica]|uniref:Uncharacterized protein n=1 Tax=Brassica cretica TaxID=69181 RepID=A0A8S9RWV7_BRACR|nr:hypothetical protein F2Q69_00026738 [Brassica cretica]